MPRKHNQRSKVTWGLQGPFAPPPNPSTCVLLLLVVGVDGPRRAVLAVACHPGGKEGAAAGLRDQREPTQRGLDLSGPRSDLMGKLGVGQGKRVLHTLNG